MDSKTLELLTLWRALSAGAKARLLEKARYVALSAGLENTAEFGPLFELTVDESVSET